jgi:hypothetical protein
MLYFSRNSSLTTALHGIPKRTFTHIRLLLSYVGRASLDVLQHEFNFRNKAALLTEIQRQTRKGGGISVRALKESWKEAPAAIEELEKEGEVLVTRTVKDGQLRMVFWNEIKPTDESGELQVEKGAFCHVIDPFINPGAEWRG